MKRTFILSALLVAISASSFAFTGHNKLMPNDRLLKSFHSTFVNAEEVKWFDHADYYEVSFYQNNIRANVIYDLAGNFLSSTRYYKAQDLPTSILCKLNKKYADKKIFGVTELTNNDEVNYYVKLEDAKNWMTVKVTGNGQMEVYEKYKKAL